MVKEVQQENLHGETATRLQRSLEQVWPCTHPKSSSYVVAMQHPFKAFTSSLCTYFHLCKGVCRHFSENALDLHHIWASTDTGRLPWHSLSHRAVHFLVWCHLAPFWLPSCLNVQLFPPRSHLCSMFFLIILVLFLQYLSYARPFVVKSDLVAALRSVRWTMRRSCKCSNACKKRKSIRQLTHVTRTLHRKLYMILETLLKDIERLETRETLETSSKFLRLRDHVQLWWHMLE